MQRNNAVERKKKGIEVIEREGNFLEVNELKCIREM